MAKFGSVFGKSIDLGDMGRIRYHGTFNWLKVVSSIEGWYSHLKYKGSIEKYSHKGKEGSAKVELKFYGHKKVSEWAKNIVRVQIFVRDLKDVEVIRQGQKETLQSGYITIELSGEIILDPYKRFAKGDWLGKMKLFINEYVIKDDIESGWLEDHYYEILTLHRLIKEVLETETATSAWE